MMTSMVQMSLKSWSGLILAGALVAPGLSMAQDKEVLRQAEQLQEETVDPHDLTEEDEALFSREPHEEDITRAVDWLEEVESAIAEQADQSEKQVRELLNDVSARRAGGSEDEGFLERAKAAVQQSPENRFDSDEEPLFALITMGLGRQTILNYLREAETMDVPVVFVVRGFDPESGGLKGFVQRFLDINEFEIEFSMQVNPVLFRKTDTQRVPAFIYTDEEDVTRVRRGGVNLHAALDAMEGPELDKTIGETREIDEPDLLTIIEDRIQNVDGEELVAEARERARAKFLEGTADLPEAKRSHSYMVDPEIKLKSDITLPDGRVVAHKGTEVNPLETAPWRRQYVIIDATSDWQVEQAKDWADEADIATTFIGTQLPDDDDERARLGETLGDHVHLIHPLIVRRMDLREVPSRARQDGLMVRIDVAGSEQGQTR